MTKITHDALFKPNMSKAETKAEAVSRAAMTMIEQEVALRDAKTARLREERLAREATDEPVKAKAKPKAKPAAKSTAKSAAAKPATAKPAAKPAARRVQAGE